MAIKPETADLLESLPEWFADRVKEICGKMQRNKSGNRYFPCF